MSPYCPGKLTCARYRIYLDMIERLPAQMDKVESVESAPLHEGPLYAIDSPDTFEVDDAIGLQMIDGTTDLLHSLQHRLLVPSSSGGSLLHGRRGKLSY